MPLGQRKAERDAEFTAFVTDHGPRLLRVAIGLSGSGDAGRELLQAGLVKTYAAWGRIRRDEAYAYTRRVMAHHRIDTWRTTRREEPRAEVPEASAAIGTRIEDHDHLVRLLATLPPQQRAVVVLRYYDDLPEAEVARLLGISVGAVKSAASRGLATLRARNGSTEPTEAGAR